MDSCVWIFHCKHQKERHSCWETALTRKRAVLVIMTGAQMLQNILKDWINKSTELFTKTPETTVHFLIFSNNQCCFFNFFPEMHDCFCKMMMTFNPKNFSQTKSVLCLNLIKLLSVFSCLRAHLFLTSLFNPFQQFCKSETNYFYYQNSSTCVILDNMSKLLTKSYSFFNLLDADYTVRQWGMS